MFEVCNENCVQGQNLPEMDLGCPQWLYSPRRGSMFHLRGLEVSFRIESVAVAVTQIISIKKISPPQQL